MNQGNRSDIDEDSFRKYFSAFFENLPFPATFFFMQETTCCDILCMSCLQYANRSFRDTYGIINNDDHETIFSSMIKPGLISEIMSNKTGYPAIKSDSIMITCRQRFYYRHIVLLDDKTGILILNDASESMNMELNYLESREKYFTMIDSLPEIVFEIDSRGKILFVNRKAIEILGYTYDELNTINAFELVDSDKSITAITEKLLSGQCRVKHSHSLKCKNDTLIPINLFLSPMETEGRISGYRGIAVDISPLVEARNRRSRNK